MFLRRSTDHRLRAPRAGLLLVALAAAACSDGTPTPITSAPPSSTSSVGLPNPASAFCEQSGGRLEIRTGADGGQVGFCVFADGSECEEWAYFRGECQPGSSLAAPEAPPLPSAASTLDAPDASTPQAPTTSGQVPTPGPGARYANGTYGFTVDLPAGWAIEESANHVIFRKAPYWLYVGFKRTGEQVGPFRTGMPSGEFVAGGSAELLGQELPKRLLVSEGKTKVVEYASGAGVGVGDLLLSIWLDAEPPQGDYRALEIPDDVVSEADAIVASLALTSGQRPQLDLSPSNG